MRFSLSLCLSPSLSQPSSPAKQKHEFTLLLCLLAHKTSREGTLRPARHVRETYTRRRCFRFRKDTQKKIGKTRDRKRHLIGGCFAKSLRRICRGGFLPLQVESGPGEEAATSARAGGQREEGRERDRVHTPLLTDAQFLSGIANSLPISDDVSTMLRTNIA